MAQKKLTKEQLQEAVDLYEAAGRNLTAAAVTAGLSRNTFQNRLREAQRLGYKPAVEKPPEPESVRDERIVDIPAAVKALLMRRAVTIEEIQKSIRVDQSDVFDALDYIKTQGVNVVREGERWRIGKTVEMARTSGKATIDIVSRPDNTFLFGASGDQHIGSKYHRSDVLHDLYSKYEDHDVQAVFNTGNWIDGEARFNTYDLVVHGLDGQAKLMAEIFPRASFPTYAVWGDDHEGWYVQREGIDVGRYVESVMREAGHDWHNLGYLEANVRLINANTGAVAIMAVIHPGGGSSYATSYRPQKILESMEGGEKPAVLLLGHYHKLDPGLVRNVWYLQTGTCQDQTPFMRKRSIEAHVGGAMIKLEQDPDTGAITGFTPSLWRYFNRAYYVNEGAANGRWSQHGPVSMIPRGIQA